MKKLRFGVPPKLLTLLLIVSSFELNAQEQLESLYDESDGTGYLLVSGNHEIIIFSSAILKLLWLAEPSEPPSLVPAWDYFVLLDSVEIANRSPIPAHLTDFSDRDLADAVSKLKVESARCSVQTTSTHDGKSVYTALTNSSQYGDPAAQVCIVDALTAMVTDLGGVNKSDTLAAALSNMFTRLAKQ